MSTPEIDQWLDGGPLDDPAPSDGAAIAAPPVVDKHGLSAFTGLALKEIERALRDGLPTHGERTKGAPLRFRVPDCVQWLLARQDDEGDTLAAAKKRERAAMARKRELEVLELEGRLVPIDDVVNSITDQVARLQSELVAIPNRLVVPQDVREHVRTEISAALARLTLREKFAP